MKQHIDALYEELYSLRADIMNDGEALFRTCRALKDALSASAL